MMDNLCYYSDPRGRFFPQCLVTRSGTGVSWLMTHGGYDGVRRLKMRKGCIYGFVKVGEPRCERGLQKWGTENVELLLEHTNIPIGGLQTPVLVRFNHGLNVTSTALSLLNAIGRKCCRSADCGDVQVIICRIGAVSSWMAEKQSGVRRGCGAEGVVMTGAEERAV
ncbi:hypothetical protein FGB62_116g011 [Gracilaria domingensis]|nr:hypothetical protein FGB62_116g011 [Gracilaria domingensis]